MRSQKIRLKPTKEQERLMWWYSKVSRNYWNLLVDIDKRNNKVIKELLEDDCTTS